MYRRKWIVLLTVLSFVLILAACQPEDKTSSDINDTHPSTSEVTTEPIETTENTQETGDTIPPLFMGVVQDIVHIKEESVDLLEGINVIDNKTKPEDLIVRVSDDGGYNPKLPGRYTIEIEAIDEAGNRSTVERQVIVMDTKTVHIQAIKNGNQYAEYVFNDTEALQYTSAGAIFRRYDVVQVMDKDFFLSEYEDHHKEYTDNGNVPFLYNGVIALLDENLRVKHVRLSSPEIEIDGKGNVKTNHLGWSNSKSQTGGGNFVGIKDAIDDYLPNGGYVIFAPDYDQGIAKKFLVQTLFDSEYDGGQIVTSRFNVQIERVQFELVENYEVTIPVEPDENMTIVNGVVKIKRYIEGIPMTIYYQNDGKDEPRPLVFFFHGMGSDRESGIMNRGIELANRGFYVVAMDAYLHGEREPGFFKQLSYSEKQRQIVNIQIRTAEEAKYLFHKYFKPSGEVLPDKAYAYGVSMGGGTAIYLATIMEELQTVVSIVGSPSFVEFYQYKATMYNFPRDEWYEYNLNSYYELDPLLNYDRLIGKNIFMGSGSQDTVVPARYAEALSDKLNHPNVVYKLYNTGHSSTAQMLKDSYDFIISH